MRINNNGLTVDEIRADCPTVFAGEAHESRSQRYLYIPTGDILAGLRKEGFVPTMVMASRSRVDGRQAYTKHLLRLRRIEDLGNHDLNVDVHEIVLINSHDGSSSYQLMSGIFRLVCTNGMIVGNYDDTLKVYHRGNIIDEVIKSTYKIVEGSAMVMEEIEEMKAIELTRPEQLLLSEFAIKARFDLEDEGETKEVVYQPSDFLRIHRMEDAHNDLYTTFNVIQENAIKGGVSRRDRKGHKHTTREIKGIDQNVKVNRLLWQFAQKLMELKG